MEQRERFRRLDRRWHPLIGSQLVFGLMLLRMHLHKNYQQGQQQEVLPQPNSSSSLTQQPQEESRFYK